MIEAMKLASRRRVRAKRMNLDVGFGLNMVVGNVGLWVCDNCAGEMRSME